MMANPNTLTKHREERHCSNCERSICVTLRYHGIGSSYCHKGFCGKKRRCLGRSALC